MPDRRASGRRVPLQPGMYVRVPIDADRRDREFRDYRLGQLREVNLVANEATVSLFGHANDARVAKQELQCPLDIIERCRVLPDSPCIVARTGQHGRILVDCRVEASADGYRDYYVLLQGEMRRMREADLIITSDRQDPRPGQQLRHYEFHSPIWRFDRDALIESYAQLRNATYGLEELVGSRVMLLAHQAEVVARVLADAQCRYILADEVGLGKTIEASTVLKGLLRRDARLTTLIVTPASLTRQWHNELDAKFWLEVPTAHLVGPSTAASRNPTVGSNDGATVLVSAEDLAACGESRWTDIVARQWGLLVVDEAHHCAKHPRLFERICALSRGAERALILSATPIQRRAEEYLALLRLMDPARYDAVGLPAFHKMIAAQETIRKVVAYLGPSMKPSAFDVDEFAEELDPIASLLGDATLVGLVARLREVRAQPRRSFEVASDVLAYISENYRIENRVIRNRRSEVRASLPVRSLDVGYSYAPGALEADALDMLYEYLASCVGPAASDPVKAEYCRVMLHAAASSPHALLDLLVVRKGHLAAPDNRAPHDGVPELDLTRPAAPRDEPARVRALIGALPPFADELDSLSQVIWRVERWREQTDEVLATAHERGRATDADAPHRLVQALRAINWSLSERTLRKVLVFSSWPRTLTLLMQPLVRSYGRAIVAEFRAGLDDEQLQEAADRFQSDPKCAVLLCDELGGEGRNFQIADEILHVDLPWTPALVEQRIGRVDRLGRTGTVRSIVPFARDQIEHDLFRIWQEAFSVFEESLSGLEIALEGIQDELVAALSRSLRQGLADVLGDMVGRAARLHEEVKEERYFEEWAINRRRRAEFEAVSERYSDGAVLRTPLLRWAHVAGLAPESDDFGDVFRFSPRHFNRTSMQNAKLFELPNMEEALRRSRRRRELVIEGTFDRSVAVVREDLVFFAPGGDAWTDAILKNAMEADRGRCCAVWRSAPELSGRWVGFELLYSLSVDPRPLYAAGFGPDHLFRAQGFLPRATYRLVLKPDGTLVDPGSPIAAAIKRPFDKRRDKHLGKRDSPGAQLEQFKRTFPADQWEQTVRRILHAADGCLDAELTCMVDMAEEAAEEFARHAAGWRAARRWIAGSLDDDDLSSVEEYERVSRALIEGIERPLRRLESVCFWYLQPEAPR
jgi:ATP-dependent helicase HepA